LEAIKCLLDLGRPLRGRLLLFNALTQEFRTLDCPRDPACPLCGAHPAIREIEAARYAVPCAAPAGAGATDPTGTPTEITVEEASRLLAAAPHHVTLLDVREPHELRICRIEGSQHIPLRQIPARLDDLPRDQRLLVLCHHGGRSRHVTEFLRAHGFPAVSNVQGGIAAWAERIDPALPRY
jgi:adenylyltransferase/sulfurtransferase